ncbi:hypothetical protein FSARC_8542 [Fusarium sarcochroum]|uniref:Rhodopsin domain-containing protein n=1 Tax=Fusarium sarcochroum TaxID=1208366 RepID=A0A8H4TSX9_9HYPO|nr:hypothetical protein FSARC_8542 [Fusarium sarcochroum]
MVKSLENLTGEDNAKVAHEQPLIPSPGFGLVSGILIYIFTAICSVFICLRVSTNEQQIPFIAASVLGTLSIHYGVSATNSYLDRYEMKNFLTVASDWACAITPFFVVYSLQMSKRSKVAVVAVLGLGALPSVAALMRIISYKCIDNKKYPNYTMGNVIVWSTALLVLSGTQSRNHRLFPAIPENL